MIKLESFKGRLETFLTALKIKLFTSSQCSFFRGVWRIFIEEIRFNIYLTKKNTSAKITDRSYNRLQTLILNQLPKTRNFLATTSTSASKLDVYIYLESCEALLNIDYQQMRTKNELRWVDGRKESSESLWSENFWHATSIKTSVHLILRRFSLPPKIHEWIKQASPVKLKAVYEQNEWNKLSAFYWNLVERQSLFSGEWVKGVDLKSSKAWLMAFPPQNKCFGFLVLANFKLSGSRLLINDIWVI